MGPKRAGELIRRAEERTREVYGDGSRVSSGVSKRHTTENAQGGRRPRRPCTKEEIERVQGMAGATSLEVEAATGIDARRVRYIRWKYGRGWDQSRGLCVCCDERPVWRESARARAMGLCKGCYLREMLRRDDEARMAAKVRQRQKRSRERRDRGGSQR